MTDVGGKAQLYETMEEWLGDPDPYGNYMDCPVCSSKIFCKHHDIFHVGECSNCGFIVDEQCDNHSRARGKCQLKKTKASEERGIA